MSSSSSDSSEDEEQKARLASVLTSGFDLKKSVKARNTKHLENRHKTETVQGGIKSRAHFSGGMLNCDNFTPEFEQAMMLKLEKHLLDKFDYDNIEVDNIEMSKKQRKGFKKRMKRGVKMTCSGEGKIVDDGEEDVVENPELSGVKVKPAHEILKDQLKKKRKFDCSDLSGVLDTAFSFTRKTKPET